MRVALHESILSVYGSLCYEIPLVTLVFTVVVPFLGWLVVAFIRKRQLELDSYALAIVGVQ
jgi:hypothetical protein